LGNQRGSDVSKKPKVVASYGDPRKPKRWPAKRIRREFAQEILDADKAPVELGFDSIWELFEWLED
jgi:hypothetical protein